MIRVPTALPSTVLSSAPWNESAPRVHRNRELSAPLSESAGQSTSWAKWKRKAALHVIFVRIGLRLRACSRQRCQQKNRQRLYAGRCSTQGFHSHSELPLNS